ncbi:hypothetical protein NQZ68_012188 [Dissostichus eleginoides]|nr:hypothetical protein NQZ68_012188 [Dissostichus eleginoides]
MSFALYDEVAGRLDNSDEGSRWGLVGKKDRGLAYCSATSYSLCVSSALSGCMSGHVAEGLTHPSLDLTDYMNAFLLGVKG